MTPDIAMVRSTVTSRAWLGGREEEHGTLGEGKAELRDGETLGGGKGLGTCTDRNVESGIEEKESL